MLAKVLNFTTGCSHLISFIGFFYSLRAASKDKKDMVYKNGGSFGWVIGVNWDESWHKGWLGLGRVIAMCVCERV